MLTLIEEDGTSPPQQRSHSSVAVTVSATGRKANPVATARRPLFYPTALLMKSPPSFLIFVLFGLVSLVILLRRREDVTDSIGFAIAACVVVALAVLSPINQGLRHVLVVFPLLCIAISRWTVNCHSTLAGRRRGASAGITAGLLLMQAGILYSSIPNHIGYHNWLAAEEPGHFISGSDLDWGQDMIALKRFAVEHQSAELHIVDRSTGNPCRHGLSSPEGSGPCLTPRHSNSPISEQKSRRPFDEPATERDGQSVHLPVPHRWHQLESSSAAQIVQSL